MAWSRIKAVLWRWMRRNDLETQLDDEVRSYIEHQIDDYVAGGMSRGDARRQALLELGGPEQVKEQVREHRAGIWLDSIAADLRHAFRVHAKRPGFALVAVLTLALGIGAATTTFSVLDTVLLRPLPYADPDELVSVWASFPEWRSDPTLALLAEEMSVAHTAFLEWIERQTVFRSAAMYVTFGEAILTGPGTPQQVRRGYATHNLFSMLGVSAEQGRLFDPDGGPEEAAVAILSHEAWRRVFGEDPGAVGSSITLDLDGPQSAFTVIGVLPAGFDLRSQDANPDPTPEIWLSMEHPTAPDDGEVIARLKPGVSIAQAQDQTVRLFGGISYSDHLPPWMPGADSPSARVVSRHEEETNHTRATLFTLFGCAGLLLVIAAGNVANLVVGRAVERESEVAMRAALGASRWRILRQLAAESLLLAAAGGVVGTAMALVSIDAFAGWLPREFPRADQVRLDLRVLAFAVGACSLVGVAFSLAPALAIRVNLDRALRRTASRLGAVRAGLQRWIAVAEVAISFALLIGGALLVQSLVRLTSVDLGLRTDNVLAVPVTTTSKYAFRLPDFSGMPTAEAATNLMTTHLGLLESFRDEVELRLGALPGVESVAAAVYGSPFSGSHTIGEFSTGADGGGASIVVEHRSVSSNYFEVLGVPILAGRTFSDAEESGAGAIAGNLGAVVNRAAAERFWRGEDPIGQTLFRGEQPRRVVGLVGNVREFGFGVETDPVVYLPIGNALGRLPTFLIRTGGEPLALAGAARDAIWAVDDRVPIGTVNSLDALLLDTYVTERGRTWLVAVFALSAVGLALVGLYGVVSRSVTSRRHEFGIRAALGARGGVLLRMVLGDGARLALIGIAIGAVGAVGGTRLLSAFLVEIDPVDARTYGAVALGILAVALLASYIPARRAARSDPMTVLRTE